MKQFKIKICGVTTVRDAKRVVESGADAIGLNFYSRSLRSVDAEQAKALTEAVGNDIAKVGVFVDSSVEDVNAIARNSGLDWIQLHGNQDLAFARQLELPFIPVIHIGQNAETKPVQQKISEWESNGAKTILLDTSVPGQLGGTGQTFCWDILTQTSFSGGIILAGGLTAANVASAIHKARPFGVDVASGIEKAPGSKDPKRLIEFVSNAKEAFGADSQA